ncbi:MAG: hypothetical protein AABO58_24680 [Acidobacteriota bacterium]
MTASYPHPWLPAEAGVLISITFLILAVLSAIRALRYWYTGAHASGFAVPYPQFMKTREQLRGEIQALTFELRAVTAAHETLVMKLVADQPRHIDTVAKAQFGYDIQISLTPEQRDIDVIVYAVPTVKDSAALAADIVDLLSFGRIERAQFVPQGRRAGGGDIIEKVLYGSGIWIVGRLDGVLERALVKLFLAMGFDAYIDESRNHNLPTIEIIVGSRGSDPFDGADRRKVRHMFLTTPIPKLEDDVS